MSKFLYPTSLATGARLNSIIYKIHLSKVIDFIYRFIRLGGRYPSIALPIENFYEYKICHLYEDEFALNNLVA